VRVVALTRRVRLLELHPRLPRQRLELDRDGRATHLLLERHDTLRGLTHLRVVLPVLLLRGPPGSLEGLDGTLMLGSQSEVGDKRKGLEFMLDVHGQLLPPTDGVPR